MLTDEEGNEEFWETEQYRYLKQNVILDSFIYKYF